jgi:hypothetical protein
MSKFYIKFKCVGGNPTQANQCTTEWASGIKCSIPMSGIVDNDFYNLMIMEGNASEINTWVNINSDKVSFITKEQADVLGQQIIPPNTILDNNDGYFFRATAFDVEHPELLWEKYKKEN